MEEHWPMDLYIPMATKLIPMIPKLHEPMHVAANHKCIPSTTFLALANQILNVLNNFGLDIMLWGTQ
jgi:hypothetical protein